MNKSLDQVILVNEQDEPIGVMDKVAAHRGTGKLHRAISVYLFRKLKIKNQGLRIEILLQQRSQAKFTAPLEWANTVCGNVRPGETYLECAQRRLREELGIIKLRNLKTKQLTPLYKFQYQVKCNEEFSENEIDQVFVGFYDEEITPNPEEVKTTKWIEWNKLSIDHCSLKIVFAPWFVWMLNDKKLIKKINQYLRDNDRC